MKILGIDPGTEQSAYVILETTPQLWITGSAILPNEDMAAVLDSICHAPMVSLAKLEGLRVAVESMQSFGKVIGKEILETCFWAGEFRRICKINCIPWAFYYRSSIKAAITGQAKAKDSDVRRALIMRYGGTTKDMFLHGITTHMWSALAVATYCMDGAKVGGW